MKTVDTHTMKTVDANTLIAVRTPSAQYEVEIGAGLVGLVGERVDALLAGGLKAGKQRAFVVTSPEIDRLWCLRWIRYRRC